jgi:hypothetical protein
LPTTPASRIERTQRRDARPPGAGARLEQHGQAIRVRVRQRTDQHAVDHREHRGVDPDSDRERRRRRDGEERRAEERAGGVARVLQRGLEPHPDVGVARPVAERHAVAEQPPRFAPRVAA